MNARLRKCLSMIMLACLPAGEAGLAQGVLHEAGPRGMRPEDADIERMRSELQAKMREREAATEHANLLYVEELAAGSEVSLGRDEALLTIASAMDALRGLIVIESVAGGLRIQVPVLLKGNQQIRLPLGEYRVRGYFGRPDGARPIELDGGEFRLRRRAAGRLNLDEKFERQAKRLLAEQNRPRLQAEDEPAAEKPSPGASEPATVMIERGLNDGGKP